MRKIKKILSIILSMVMLISAVNITSFASENEAATNEEIYATYASTQLKVVDDISEMVYTNNISLGGYGAFSFTEHESQAASQTTALKVNGGEMIRIKPDCEIEGLNFYVKQFNSTSMNKNTRTSTNVTLKTYFALEETTQYIIICFKHTDGTSFTDEQVASLSDALEMYEKGAIHASHGLKVVDDISDMVYTNGIGVGGAGTYEFTESASCATSMTTALEVNGGETIQIKSDCEIDGLQFYVKQFSSATMDKNSRVHDLGAVKFGTYTTLKLDAKYIIICFRKSDESSFTDEEVASLPNVLEMAEKYAIYDSYKLEIVNDISEMVYTNNIGVGGAEDYTFTESIKFASSQTTALRVSGDETIRIKSDCEIDGLQFYVKQFSSTKMNSNSRTHDPVVEFGTSRALKSETGYIIICFMRADGTSFTDEEVASLSGVLEVDKTYATHGGEQLKIVDDISDMVYTNGIGVGGAGEYEFKESETYATSMTTALEVNGGETIRIKSDCEIDGLQFYVKQFRSAAMNRNYRVHDLSTPNFRTYTTLKLEAKYIIICFQKSDGTSFSSEEVVSLSDALEMDEKYATYASHKLKVVDDISDMVYTNNTGVGGAEDYTFTESEGFASSMTTALKVYGGDVIRISSDCEIEGLQIYVKQFSSTTMDQSSCTDNITGMFDTSVTMNEETKYIIISFQKSDGTSFSSEEVASLSKMLEMSAKLRFTETMTYQTENTLSQAPKTISAWIQLNQDIDGRGGVILGNYKDSKTPGVSFEIYEDGQPRFYYINGSGNYIDIKFKGDVKSDDWVHLAYVVNDDNQTVSCYVNGVACTLSSTSNSKKISVDWDLLTNPYCLGGDLRDKNAQYYKGHMLRVDLYNEVLSADEIADIYSDASEVTGYASYNLENQTIKDDIVNQLSNDGTDNFIAWPRYFDTHEVNDYAYSFAVIGDTQIVTEYDVAAKTEHLNGIYDWILNNQESKNIQYVFGLGDITDNNSEAEWNVAQTAIERLNGKIPYSLVRGNHDMAGYNNVTTDFFTTKLGTEAYKNQFDEFYEDTNTWNAWRTFTVGKVNYLLLSLDYGANDEVLTWAGEVISAHPEHNVIITTHAYLYRDGTTLDDKDECPPSKATTWYSGLNDGDDIWDKLISQHDNIVLVMSGHDPCEDIVVTQTPGKNGTMVTQMLIDPQGVDVDESVTGMVAMLYFSEDGRNVQVEYYSTVREKFFKRNNQFEFDIATVDGELDFETASMDVSDSLAMNYTISVGESLLESEDTVKVVIDGPGEETNYTLNSDDKNSEGAYTFAYTDIRAHELTDTITVTVTAGNVTKSYKYSVLEYCKDVLELTDEELKEQKYDTDDISALRDMVIDLVQYGAALVEYRGGNAEQYTNAISAYTDWDLEDNVTALAQLKDDANSGYVSEMLRGTQSDSYSWKNIGLTLKDKVNIRATFEAENIDELIVKVYVGNAGELNATFTKTDFVKKSGSTNQYYVYFDKLMAYQYGETVTFKFFAGEASESTGATLTYSVNTYLYNMGTYQNASNDASVTAVQNLLPYINEYGWAAVSYYTAKQTTVEEQ